MDLSQYAELFLAESREHLSACNHLLLEWERRPTAPEPVGGIFRAVHTVKGMAATMGYARVAELAHRMENLLDHLRRGTRGVSDDVLQLLFRSADALEKAINLSVVGREREADVTGIAAELDAAAARLRPGGGGGGGGPGGGGWGQRARAGGWGGGGGAGGHPAQPHRRSSPPPPPPPPPLRRQGR